MGQARPKVKAKPASISGQPVWGGRGQIGGPGVPYVIPAPPQITYVNGPLPGDPEAGNYPGTADLATHTVYLQPPVPAFVRAHETGHIFDNEVLTPGDRLYFQKLMQAPSGAWTQGTGYSGGGLHSPNEWFADYYAASATHLDPTHEGVSSYAKIGPKRLARFEQALTRLAQRYKLGPYQP